VDIKVYPKEQFGFALLYFTGSGDFNRDMRFKAQKMGYSLSDFGLVQTKGKRAQINCETEEDVFKGLKMEYKAPHERNM